jgi:ACS family D-galactonate transporter-like MFS transporter
LTSRQAPLVAIVWLLASSVFINYIDRTNLGIAGPLIRSELHLSGAQFGFISSAFFATYAFSQLLSGWLADRLDVKWILAGGFGLWTLATGLTGLVHTFGALLLARLVLGVGESVAYPSYARILVDHFPEDRRGGPNAAISAGFSLGLSCGMLFGGMLVARTGWRPFFVGLALLSLLWLIPWLLVMPRSAPHTNEQKSQSPPFWRIALHRDFLGTALALFCTNYFSYTLLTWLPSYLIDARGFSMDQMAYTGGVVYLVVAATSMAFGRFADRRIASGASTAGIRRSISAAGLAISAVFLFVAAMVPGGAGAVVCLIGGGFGFGVVSSSHWAATQTLAGPLATGRWTGMENCIGNVAGMIAPVVVGVVLDLTGHYHWALAFAALVTLIGAAAWLFIIRDLREVNWAA